jgi:predicted pyridoxine 5'-phosphate oxidase superfamily flavin-nucleotide-binding protein
MQSIPEELIPALQGAIPATLTTCSLEGEPNIAFLHEVYQVDEFHVALSRQFFNKTIRNMMENPQVNIQVCHPGTGEDWRLVAEYVRSETEGELFDTMQMQLEAIASNEGLTGVYSLLSADVCKIISIERCNR